MKLNPAEFIFVIDWSGSMEGNSIKVAVDAMRLFIRSLPLGSKFNIVSFGSEFSSLFSANADYTKENVNIALEFMKTIKADLGGTEILEPLKHIFTTSKTDTGLSKQVYLLTDGQISNEEGVLNLITENSDKFTVHSFGIGSGVSTQLIIKSAENGHGEHYFVNDHAEGLNQCVIESLRAGVDDKF